MFLFTGPIIFIDSATDSEEEEEESGAIKHDGRHEETHGGSKLGDKMRNTTFKTNLH